MFAKIGTTTAMSYDDVHVQNEITYRYYVCTYGHYTLEGLPRPLVNFSAIIEVKPTAEEPEPEPDQPVYELPNAFTPNGDGFNDVFVPMRVTPDLITHVKMHIFNRWGRTVFDTDDIRGSLGLDKITGKHIGECLGFLTIGTTYGEVGETFQCHFLSV